MDRRVDEACSITDILTGEDLFMSSSIAQLTGWEADDFHKGGFGFGMSLIHPDDVVGGVMNIFEQEIENGTGSLFCTTTWFGKHPSATERRMENTYASEQRHLFWNETKTWRYVWSCRPSVNMNLINEKVSRLLEPIPENRFESSTANRISISNSSTD